MNAARLLRSLLAAYLFRAVMLLGNMLAVLSQAGQERRG